MGRVLAARSAIIIFLWAFFSSGSFRFDRSLLLKWSLFSVFSRAERRSFRSCCGILIRNGTTSQESQTVSGSSRLQSSYYKLERIRSCYHYYVIQYFPALTGDSLMKHIVYVCVFLFSFSLSSFSISYVKQIGAVYCYLSVCLLSFLVPQLKRVTGKYIFSYQREMVPTIFK